MDGYTRDAQTPPEPTRVTDIVVMRYEHVFEVVRSHHLGHGGD